MWIGVGVVGCGFLFNTLYIAATFFADYIRRRVAGRLPHCGNSSVIFNTHTNFRGNAPRTAHAACEKGSCGPNSNGIWRDVS